MKDIKQIKDEVAIERGYKDWMELMRVTGDLGRDILSDIVAIRYANEQKQELIEVLKECLDWEYMSVYNEDLYERIEELITKHKQS